MSLVHFFPQKHPHLKSDCILRFHDFILHFGLKSLLDITKYFDVGFSAAGKMHHRLNLTEL